MNNDDITNMILNTISRKLCSVSHGSDLDWSILFLVSLHHKNVITSNVFLKTPSSAEEYYVELASEELVYIKSNTE